MPQQRHYYGLNHLHFITASIYRRARLFGSIRFKRNFVEALDALRSTLPFKVIGYVLNTGNCPDPPRAETEIKIRPSSVGFTYSTSRSIPSGR